MPTFTAHDGITLHYTDHGEGTPILCLSGLTRNGQDFNYVAPHLADHRVIRLDYRGRGKSDWADPATYQIANEARDVLDLLDHLGLEQTAILGTSRGGLIAMVLAAIAHDRLTGVCLNDIGPELDPRGLDVIMNYIGKNPSQKTWADAAAIRGDIMRGFANVPLSRWQDEVRTLFHQTPDGLHITYDPALADAVAAAGAQPAPDLWPLFDALAGLPICAIRGANSDLLSAQTLADMRKRRPDMITATVPDRAHIPFLDEPEALDALQKWTALL
ncbi:alpha/beta fold hydrolase [Nereida sp. MMG025]|uniref:alpha/beta fold hydrolase n=1 Tax=Nereida sp. MMG025 TaxID=2909981 RepID=UPI001F1E4871|nr:alpha/beta hydrolase [Nereida sp. MMG025]MCF6445601.1 alpha/beta hydrolase [Nereida sp. MMG025]